MLAQKAGPKGAGFLHLLFREMRAAHAACEQVMPEK